ncbi:MAG: NAD-binding protein [Candidatus Neomarinimicrobiota bacterium]
MTEWKSKSKRRLTRFRRILLLVFGTLLIATVGFRILGGGEWSLLDSIYMVVQSLPFVVIESDDEKIRAIAERDYIHVQGDATADETLEKANIKEASGLVVVLSSDSDILFVTMSARTLNPDLLITSRCSVEENVPKLMRAGANKVVNPYIAGGHKMAELAVAPYVEDSVEISTPTRSVDLLMEEIMVKNIDGYSGKLIRESRLREEFQILIAGVIDENGEMVFNPDPDTTLKDSHTLMLMGEKEKLARFKKLACRKRSDEASPH